MRIGPLLTLACAAAVLSCSVLPAEAASTIKITKVYVNSPGDDLPTTNAKLNAEYTVIKNTGKASRTMTGWTLRDESGHVYTFGSYKLKAGASVKIRNGSGDNTSKTRYWGSAYYIWNNSAGDSATLRTSGGTRIDRCSWTTEADYRNC